MARPGGPTRAAGASTAWTPTRESALDPRTPQENPPFGRSGGVTSTLRVSDARRAAPPSPVDDAGPESLAAILDELETLSRFERDGIEDHAELVAAAARGRG